ncbi:MAG: hypothetical protein DKINENOH_05405 [bacterium]|nr:hypothetical protein [bacterium]
MKNSNLLQTQSALFLLALLLAFHSALAQTDELQQIKHAIAQRGANWTASVTWLMKLSPEARTKRSAIPKPSHSAQAKLFTIPRVENLPTKFDWRNNNGNWVTPPKNEYAPIWCGVCWDMAALGMIESWWKIHNNNPDSVIDLSEQFVLSCGDAGSCSGGFSELVLDLAKNVGIPSEACFPYQANDDVPCSRACDNWADEAVQIPGWGYVAFEEVLLDNVKSALYRHPVVAGMTVYRDFMSYAGGVYEHVWGDVVYGHYILIVGWDDEQQCWIGKNSFGTDWGETAQFTPYTPGAGDGGYCRIKYGDCNIGVFCHTIWDEITGGPALSISPHEKNIALTVGDSLSTNVVLSNSGATVLDYVALDYESQALPHFHSDSRNAWNGLSWWCGDPEIGGYDNSWLQYLDLPLLNLSNTMNPKLSCMGFWALETPPSSSELISVWYDGWDAVNVWVSSNGGSYFEVARPSFPEYNCQSTFSFGDAYGWKMGAGIPGWGGKSGGWIPVEFDLSSYKADSVIVRFAFASDPGYCTQDDRRLTGFFVDDIKVSDGSIVLFENHGDLDSSLHRAGFAGLKKADWLEVSPGFGNIPPNNSLDAVINIKTRHLTPGQYCGLIFFTSNDTTHLPAFYSESVQINLEVREGASAVSDIPKIPVDWKLVQNYPNPFNPNTTIEFALPKASFVTLKIYNLLGNGVATVVAEKLPAGKHQRVWEAKGLASGVYLYRLEAGEFAQTKKLLLLR